MKNGDCYGADLSETPNWGPRWVVGQWPQLHLEKDNMSFVLFLQRKMRANFTGVGGKAGLSAPTESTGWIIQEPVNSLAAGDINCCTGPDRCAPTHGPSAESH